MKIESDSGLNLIARAIGIENSGDERSISASADTKSESPEPQTLPSSKEDAMKSRAKFQFPWKLYEMLEAAENDQMGHIVSWTGDGHSFRVHEPQLFVDLVLPVFFKQSKYKSFQRQLNLYGFSRINDGPLKGGYQHERFVRGQKELCQDVMRELYKPHKYRTRTSEPSRSDDTSSNTTTVILRQSGMQSTNGSEVVPSIVEKPRESLVESTILFPERLYTMLEKAEVEGFEDIVSWSPGGECFMVHDNGKFVDHIMPAYFRQSKFKSFQRQLNNYGFFRIAYGPNKGAYTHDLFRKGNYDMLVKIGRQVDCRKTQVGAQASKAKNTASQRVGRGTINIDNSPTSSMSTPSWRSTAGLFSSDIVIEAIDESTQETSRYPVHREMMSKAGNPKLPTVLQPNNTTKLFLKLSHSDALLFPDLLDMIYDENKTESSMAKALALYGLADQLDLVNILTRLTRFLVENMTKENLIDFLTVALSFRNTALLDGAIQRVSEMLLDLDTSVARLLKPMLLIEVLQRNKLLEKEKRASSTHVSELVASCLEGNELNVTFEVFQQLVDKENLPKLSGAAAIKIMAFEHRLLGPLSFVTDSSLRIRCTSSITENWQDLKGLLEGNTGLAERFKTLPSPTLYAILMGI